MAACPFNTLFFIYPVSQTMSNKKNLMHGNNCPEKNGKKHYVTKKNTSILKKYQTY